MPSSPNAIEVGDDVGGDSGGDFDSFAPPPFNAANTLVALKRQLRDFKLTERNGGARYEWSGRSVIEIASGDATSISIKLAKKPALSPEWATHTLRTSADVRKFQDLVKQQLARWADVD